MPTVIGTIKVMMGQAWIEAADGSRRQAMEGEQVMRGEQVVTEQGAVTVTLPDGKSLDLGRMSQWGGSGAATATADATATQDVASVQQAITEGADPTQILEATAAGNPIITDAQGEAGEGGRHSFVMLELTGQILDPNAGYPTDGLGSARPDRVEEDTSLFGTNTVDLNNPAIIGGDDTGAVVEDDSDPTLVDSGRLSIHDPDEAQSWFVTNSVKASDGALGNLILARDGSWRYEVNNADVQYLAEGETKIETFVVKSADGTEHTVTITITGRNDLPVLSADDGSVTEDNGLPEGHQDIPTELTTSGSLSFTDVDSSDSHAVSTTGELMDLKWSHSDSLPEGIEAALRDGTFTLNDAKTGWEYSISNAATQFLAAGETVTLTYQVTVDDGHGVLVNQDVVITITGTNDLPVVTANDGALTEDNGLPEGHANIPVDLTVSGDISFTDVDSSDSHVVSTTGDLMDLKWSHSGSLPEGIEAALRDGTFMLNDAKTGWEYSISNAATQFLAAGETVTLTYQVTVDDGHGVLVNKDVVITITGTNDLPVLSADDGSVTEDNGLPEGHQDIPTELMTSGSLSFTDVDSSDSHAVSTTGELMDLKWSHSGSLPEGIEAALRDGTFTLNDAKTGWEYSISNAATQFLAAGETVTLTYQVTVDDGHGVLVNKDVIITITGTNDLPVLSADDGSVTEDNGLPEGHEDIPVDLTVSGDISFTDVDSSDSHVVSTTGDLMDLKWSHSDSLPEGVEDALRSGEFRLNDTKTGWEYSISNAATQFLAAGETVTLTYQVAVDDGHGVLVSKDVVITITGTNDAPTITSTVDAALSEKSLVAGSEESNHAIGKFSIGDVDSSDTLTVSLSGPSSTLKSGGETIKWTWDPVSNKLVGSIGEAGNVKTVIEVSLTSPEGGSRGEWSYEVTLKGPVDHPGVGEDSLSLDITVKVSDDHNVTTETTLPITIKDDVPTIGNNPAVLAESTDIPTPLIGEQALWGSKVSNADSLAFNDFTVTAKGFTSAENSALIDAKVNQSTEGLGVNSVAGPYHNIENEIDFRHFADGNSVSEELIFTLNEGLVAYGVTIEFSKMFGGELESGIVEFYRDGVLIASEKFNSNAASGNYAANFKVQEGGFDTMVIKATDNGNTNRVDNSDLTVKKVTFIGPETPDAIAYASGEVGVDWGADGKGSMTLTGYELGLLTSSGLEMKITQTGNTVLAEDTNGDLVFRMEFTPETGKWEFYQYQQMQQPGDDNQIDFKITVTDGDGDSSTGSFAVIPLQSEDAGVSSVMMTSESESPDPVIVPDEQNPDDSNSGQTLYGDSTNSTIIGTDGDDIIYGGDGNDILYGGAGNDKLYGGAGDDILIGGKGNDTLYGGEGHDTFKWQQGDYGKDVIKDFNIHEDKIDLTELLEGIKGNFSDFVNVSDNGGDAIITINTEGLHQGGSATEVQITVENCTSTDIDSLIAKPDALI